MSSEQQLKLSEDVLAEHLMCDPLFGRERRSVFDILCQVRAVSQAGVLCAEEATKHNAFLLQDLFAAILWLANEAETLRYLDDQLASEALAKS